MQPKSSKPIRHMYTLHLPGLRGPGAHPGRYRGTNGAVSWYLPPGAHYRDAIGVATEGILRGTTKVGVEP